LERHPERNLLIPENAEETCRVNPISEQITIRGLFLYPFGARPKNLKSVWEPLCVYIKSHYHLTQKPSRQGYGWGVWVPN
jgi:hypothetical protein